LDRHQIENRIRIGINTMRLHNIWEFDNIVYVAYPAVVVYLYAVPGGTVPVPTGMVFGIY
jgi:hypothetical protein